MEAKFTLALLALAAASLNLRAATQALHTPLPEFMDDVQAAQVMDGPNVAGQWRVPC